MGKLTMGEVLQMPIIRAADPEVVAGKQGLGRAVRWVHSTELADIAPLLRAGELILSTGIALPEDAEGLHAFAASLVQVDAAGLMVELGRRWRETLPDALIKTCADAALPLITLKREVRFAAVAQVMGERIVDEQLGELRTAERIHETFTGLSLNEAGPKEILQAVQRIAGVDIVLESEHHRVVDFVAGQENTELLNDWYERSRAVVTGDKTAWDPKNGWLIARVGRRDKGWGRLIVHAESEPPHHLYVLAERAAAALALDRLHDRDRHNALRRTHHELLLALLADPLSEDTTRRCELAGVPMKRRQFVGLTFRPVLRADRPQALRASAIDQLFTAVVQAAHNTHSPALVCEIDRDVRVLLSMTPRADADKVVSRIAASVARGHDVIIGAGRSTLDAGSVDDTLRESVHVVASVPEADTGPTVHRLEDTHLRGLLTLLGDDERLRLFAERELAPLRSAGSEEAQSLTETLEAMLDHPHSKSDAAARLHLSRPAFYGRLAKLEKALGRSLDDPETRTSLHVALMATRITRKPRSSDAPTGSR